MDTVKLKKHELLKELNANLDTHKEELAELLQERRFQMGVYFEEELERLRGGGDEEYQVTLTDFPMPENHVADYEKVIKMVKMSVDDVIELDGRQFDKYVMDNWSWKDTFINTKFAYGK